MKIGIEVQRIFRKRKFGIEISALEFIRKITEVAPEHQYVIFAKDDEDRACLEAGDNMEIKTVPGKFFVDFEQVFLPLAARHQQVDILHCTGNTAPYFSPVPIIQTLHDVIFMDAISGDDTFYQRFGNHYRRKMVPLVTPRSKAIITVSEHEKERIINRLGIPREKVHVVYNGINEKRFHRSNDSAGHHSVKMRYGLPENFILFLGNPSHRKNPARVIEAYITYAAKCTHPLPLVTPGLSETFIADTLRKLKYPYDKSSFITPGYIRDIDLPQLYESSKFFLFPSLSEGFGMPIVEAMACGTPVITSNVSSMPEIAGDAALLINPLNSDELADAMLALSENEALRQRKIRDGLWNAKRFTWSKNAAKVMGLYTSVFKEAKSRHSASSFIRKQVYAARD